MTTTEVLVENFNTLTDDKKEEVLDFVNFLKYKEGKERILYSDKEERLTFHSADELMNAIENGD